MCRWKNELERFFSNGSLNAFVPLKRVQEGTLASFGVIFCVSSLYIKTSLSKPFEIIWVTKNTGLTVLPYLLYFTNDYYYEFIK